MNRMAPLFLLALFACSDKTTTPDDSGKEDDTGKSGDDSNVESQPPDDTNVPIDDGRLRPGFWRVDVVSVPVDSCGFGVLPGNSFPMEVTQDGEGNHFIDMVQRVIYSDTDPGHFMANGVGLRTYDGIDCQLETRINANGEFSDYMNIGWYGRENTLTFSGTECSQADINGGQNCVLDLVLSAVWQGEEAPDSGS